MVVKNLDWICEGLAGSALDSLPTSRASAAKATAIRARPRSSMCVTDPLMNRDARIVGMATFPW